MGQRCREAVRTLPVTRALQRQAGGASQPLHSGEAREGHQGCLSIGSLGILAAASDPGDRPPATLCIAMAVAGCRMPLKAAWGWQTSRLGMRGKGESGRQGAHAGDGGLLWRLALRQGLHYRSGMGMHQLDGGNVGECSCRHADANQHVQLTLHLAICAVLTASASSDAQKGNQQGTRASPPSGCGDQSWT